MRVPLMMILVVSVFTLLVDGYLCFFVRKRANASHWGKWIFGISTVLCWIFFAVALSLPRREGDSSILPVMWMLYCYITVYISKSFFIIISLFGFIPRHRRCPCSPRISTVIGLAVSATVCLSLAWGALVGRKEIEVTQFDMASSKVPAAFDGYRIVQFSDAHLGTWGNDTAFISQLVDSINAQKADIVVFTGDLVNRNTGELLPFVKTLSRIKAKDGVYSVLGNHDYGDYQSWNSNEEHIANNMQMRQLQKQMGWRLLNNSHVFLTKGNDTVPLIGVENWGEPPFGQYGSLDKAYPADRTSRYHQKDSLFKILLSHNPEHWRRVVTEKSNIDLTLSGHTHAMQFMVSIGEWRWSPAKYRYQLWGGGYTHHDEDTKHPMTCYVNIGSGEVGLPYRIGATPEITVITLKRKAK